MNLSKEQPRLSRGQIDAVAEAILEKNPAAEHLLSGLKDFLTKKFGQQPGAKEESWPYHYEKYFCLTSSGEVGEETWNGSDFDLGVKEIGNFYRTKEEAEAKAQLLRHINKFRKDDWHSESVYRFGGLGWEICDVAEEDWYFEALWSAGLLLPYDSTEEDRAERIDLLQKCFS